MIYQTATLEQILSLRAAVLRPGLPLSDAIFKGDEDPRTCHFAALDENVVAGCLTMMAIPLDGRPAWQLRGMAVAPEQRGSGVGRTLIEHACVAVQSMQDFKLAWCNARTQAVGFYTKHGWKVISEEFVIPGVGPHFRMSREL